MNGGAVRGGGLGGGLGGRWLGRTGAVGFVLAALALGRAVGAVMPEPDEDYERPHEVAVAFGEPAQLRTGTITVERPRVATVVQAASDLFETSGVWVVVDVELVPSLEDASVSYVEALDRQGRPYRPAHRSSTCVLGTPDLPTRCSVAVELPPEEVPGAVLRLGTHPLDPRFDSLAVVALGLDAADVAAGQALTEPVVLRSPDEPETDTAASTQGAP